jgi:tetratricopeptide (TPR) repeat protein
MEGVSTISIGSKRRTAQHFVNTGQFTDAINAYQELLDADASRPDDWYNLGYALRAERHFHEAVFAYNQAIRRNVARPEEVLLNLSVIYSDHLGDPDNAAQCLDLAIRNEPRFLLAYLNLASLCEDLGQFGRAIGTYDQVLRIAPTNGRALGRQATLKYRMSPDAGIVAVLKTALYGANRNDEDALELNFALGHILDSKGAYRDAMAAFDRANAIARKASSPALQISATSPADIIKSFPDNDIRRSNNLTDKYIFICGMFRSGSTLAEHLLSRHSLITSAGELEALPAIARSLGPAFGALRSMSVSDLDRLSQTYIAEVDCLHGNARFVIDKRPDNYLNIGVIKRLFPRAKIIHTFRNPLDNLLSLYFGNFDPSVRYATSLEDAASTYRDYQKVMSHWQGLYRDDIFDLDYDLLVRSPETVVRTLTEFCDLPPSEALFTEQAEGPIRTLSNWQVRQPLHARSSGRWTNYSERLSGARRILSA